MELAGRILHEADRRVNPGPADRRGVAIGPGEAFAPEDRVADRLLLVRGAEQDVNLAAVGLPAGLRRFDEEPIRLGDPAVEKIAILVLGRTKLRVAAGPELQDKCAALVIVRESAEGIVVILAEQVPDRPLAPPLDRLVVVVRVRRGPAGGGHRKERGAQHGSRARPSTPADRSARAPVHQGLPWNAWEQF